MCHNYLGGMYLRTFSKKPAPDTVPSVVILSKNTPLCKQSNHFFLHGLFCYKNEKNEYINRHGILNEK